MNGGKSIVGGIVVLLIALWQLTCKQGFAGLGLLFAGGIPLLLIVLGGLFLWMGISDLNAARKEAKASASKS
ncbi:MAG: hypothetical protein IT204_22870 [Fimbriimonadaceae bacterium]|nr:hypothetical protein [Fimbriimonadaceae bacterium]